MRKSNKEFSEDLKRRIYAFIIEAVTLIEELPQNDPVCRVIKNQSIRSISSIGANYIEATASASDKEFALYIGHSLKSANESKFWLAFARDMRKAEAEKINKLLKELIEISNILGSSLSTIRNR
jgi:four helix bundle protein